MDTAYQLQKEANKAERKAQRATEKAEREPEESDQKAKKVRKAEKAKAKAELARSKLKAERGAVSNLRWHGNRVGMPRIDFLHDKPEGWKDMWNQRLAAWKARQKKKEDQEKVKGEQPDESGDKEKKSEPERPGSPIAGSEEDSGGSGSMEPSYGFLEPKLGSHLRIIPKEGGRGIRLLLRLAGMSQDLQR